MINLVGPTVPESEPYFKASIENNHRQLGEFAATNLVEGLKKENRMTANIFVVTGAKVQPEVAVRMDGFKSVLDKYPEYKVVDILDGNCPDQGEILVDGTPVTLTNARQVQAAGIAVVEQELSRVPALTVLENILLGRVGANLRSRTDDRRQVQGLLTRLGLNDVRPDTMVEDLSMAERQPVEIARALRRNARILILDEPTATLGEREIERVFAGVRELANAGSSVIFVSHRLGEVLDLCSQVTALRDGPDDCLATRCRNVSTKHRRAHARKVAERSKLERRHNKAREGLVFIDQLSVPGHVTDFGLRASGGEIVAIAGQVGSGASEVLRALAGLMPDARGHVSIAGRPHAPRRPAAVD